MVCSHPDSSFVSKTAHALLARIPEALLADVLKTLTRSEVIAENNPEDERILGRKFALTSRWITVAHVAADLTDIDPLQQLLDCF